MSPEVRARTPTPDRSPKAIGPYAIRNRIGRGAMGVVYRAVDERTKSVVALKAMISDLDGDPETRERFFREAHVAGKLRHRNIVTVLDSGEDGGRLYIAMELLSGETLSDEMKDSDFTNLEDRIDLMIQVCQGLQVAHAAGVYHRDIKPANLFVCEDRRVKILDFGVARLVGSNMTVTGNIIGTPDFMSPEQVRGQNVDERSDIFSAGSVFYLLLTGRKPFAASDLPAVLNKVVRAQPLPIREDEAPEVLAAVIRRAMSKDPEARQQTIAQLATDLMTAAAALEATTRHRALDVRRMAETIIQLTRRQTELSTKLEIPNGEDPWNALGTQYPVLQRGCAVLGTFPLRSGVVASLEVAVKTVLDALAPAVSVLEDGYGSFEAGETLFAGGALDQAETRYAAARSAVPSSPVIARAIDDCAKAIDAQREREARLQARLTLAAEAAQRTDWPAVLAIVKDIQDAEPANADAERLRIQASKNLDLERARSPRDRSERNTGVTSAAPPPDKTSDSGGRQHEESSSPHTAGGAGTGEAPRDEAEAKSERTQRGAQAARLNEDAGRHFAAGDLVAAERLASQSVLLNGEDAEARHLLERLRTAILLQGNKDEKWRRVTERMQRANGFADRKQYDRALALVDEALSIDASHPSAAEMRTRFMAERAAHDAAQAAKTARHRRTRAAAPALQQAQRAFRDGDLERARWSAENALALAPDSPEALALLAQIDAATPAPSPDDTVKLDDPQSDTAEMAPLRPSLQERMSELRVRASTWMRRRGAPEAKDR